MPDHPPHPQPQSSAAIPLSRRPEPSKAELEAWDRRHVWHPFTQMAEYEPLLIERGEGCWVYDADRNRLLDGVSSLWCNVHGHNHPKINAAISAQLGRIAHTTALGASNSTTIKLARRLAEISPEGLEHVFFSDDGATSVEVALKLAFQYWRQRPDPRPGKTRFLAFENAYHGDTLGDVSVGGVALFHKMFAPLLFPAVRAPVPHPYRPPAGVASEAVLPHCLAVLEKLLAEHHEELAACVVEPLIQGAAGMIMPPPGFLAGVRALTRKYDVLLIADEVAVGFGRTGTMFACEQEGVAPDLLCLAKGLTGGYLPLAATLATTEIWNAFLGGYGEAKSFFHGHTYGGNPLGAAAALATLDLFEEEQTLAAMQPKIARLAERLAEIATFPHVGDVRRRGLVAGIELVADRAAKTPYPWDEKWGLRVCRRARDYGVLLRPLGNVLVVMPPLSVTLEELDFLLDVLAKAIRETTDVDHP